MPTPSCSNWQVLGIAYALIEGPSECTIYTYTCTYSHSHHCRTTGLKPPLCICEFSHDYVIRYSPLCRNGLSDAVFPVATVSLGPTVPSAAGRWQHGAWPNRVLCGVSECIYIYIYIYSTCIYSCYSFLLLCINIYCFIYVTPILLFSGGWCLCRFLDKMYSLSSSEALVQFTRNPRAYLLPPQPCIPCKVCVLGPPTSGKTALAQAVAQHYNAMVHVYTYIYTCTQLHVTTTCWCRWWMGRYMYIHIHNRM